MGQSIVQPVPDDRLRDALQVLFVGRRRGRLDPRAGRLLETLQRDPRAAYFCWAVGKRAAAAAMALANPGRWALLLHSPLDAPGVDPDNLTACIAAACDRADDGGVAFVQAVADRASRRDVACLTGAGFEPLAELEMMELPLPAPSTDPLPCQPRLSWRRFDDLPGPEAEAILLATYEHSLDCPALAGLRSAADILAGHRATGVFTPETWWVACIDHRPAGVCLVNDHVSGLAATVAYLGATKPFRGMGLARAMVRHAADAAFRGRHSTLTLAVDRRNTFARDAYLREGCVVADVREVYIRPAKRASNAPS